MSEGDIEMLHNKSIAQQVVQQRMDILMDAFNNPVEDLLEYEPWADTVKVPLAISNALAPDDGGPNKVIEIDKDVIRKLTEEFEIMQNKSMELEKEQQQKQKDQQSKDSARDQPTDEQEMINEKHEILVNQLNLSLINEENIKMDMRPRQNNDDKNIKQLKEDLMQNLSASRSRSNENVSFTNKDEV